MTWFKVDDGFDGSPKTMLVPRSAIGLWTLAGSWSARYLTDGFIPAAYVTAKGVDAFEDAQALVESGLWETVDGGFRFHNWGEYNPASADVEDRRKRERERKAQQRRDRAGRFRRSDRPQNVPPDTVDSVRSESHPCAVDGVRAESHRPDPTRSDPEVLRTSNTPLPPASGGSDDDTLLILDDDHSDPDFDDFWATYPKKADRIAAERAWKKAVKRAKPAEIIAGAARYRDDPNRTSQYTKHPATWLNKGSWTNEPIAERRSRDVAVRAPSVTLPDDPDMWDQFAREINTPTGGPR